MSNKIENWTWSSVNTKTLEDQTNNPVYYYSTTKGVYLNEMHKTSSETLCKNYNETAINCNGGEWTTPSGKIGIMYVSDYLMSLGSGALSLTWADYSTLKTGWMHQNNNYTSTDTWEWTLARFGDDNGGFTAWFVDDDGDVNDGGVDTASAVRPVFYLTSDVKITSDGDGSLENPFIIEN